MLLRTAVRILWHEKEKYAGAVAGVALAVFLVILQGGFYFGFRRDITVVLDSVDADVWVVPRNQPLFDGWVAMDDLGYWKILGHPDVQGVSRIVWGYAPWRLPQTGGKDTVEVMGMEFDGGVRLKLALPRTDLSALLRPDGHVLVSRKDQEKLGVDGYRRPGIEINGREAIPVGSAGDVHLFTTAGFVLTDLDNGRSFLRMPEGLTTYIVCKLRPAADRERVRRALERALPDHEVLTTGQFHERAASYWTERTSIGPLLALCSVLSVVVGFLIVMLAFYVSTIEKIPVFACMKALGASNGEVVTILVFQAIIVLTLGCLLGGLGLYGAAWVLTYTSISVRITPELVAAGLGVTILCSGASSLLSIRKLISADPGEAFR